MLTVEQIEGELNMRNYFLGEPPDIAIDPITAPVEPPIVVKPPVPDGKQPFMDKFGSILIVGFALLVALAIFPEKVPGESEVNNAGN